MMGSRTGQTFSFISALAVAHNLEIWGAEVDCINKIFSIASQHRE